MLSPGMNPLVSFIGRTGMYWMIPCLAMATILSPGLIPALLRNFSGITTWYFFETVTVSIVHQIVQRFTYRYKFCAQLILLSYLTQHPEEVLS